MQVFVPSENFAECARVLDNKRLYKQLLECVQILGVILEMPKDDGTPRKGWTNHPAVLAWKFWPGALMAYSRVVAEECRRRGLNSASLEAKLDGIEEFAASRGPDDRGHEEPSLPVWWGDAEVHASHRARLLQKDPVFYSQFGWPETDDPNLSARAYEWPIPNEDGTDYRLEKRGGG